MNWFHMTCADTRKTSDIISMEVVRCCLVVSFHDFSDITSEWGQTHLHVVYCCVLNWCFLSSRWILYTVMAEDRFSHAFLTHVRVSLLVYNKRSHICFSKYVQ